ncbi:MAG: phosphoglucomutase/phosphomannomutase family protein [Chloroflexota bacterium]
MSGIKFGTDGWRAVIAEDFTFDNVRVCAQAVADLVLQSGTAERGVVAGYDTRFASEDFALAAAEVLARNGIKALLCTHPTPTPVVSHAVLATKAAGGIIITASHNPARYNGFKYKSQDGASAPTEIIEALERNVAVIVASSKPQVASAGDAFNKGLITEYDADPAYFADVSRLVDLEGIRRSGLKIVYDAMYGAGAGYFHRFLQGGDVQLEEVNGERNPSFPGINPEPIARHLGKLCRLVIERKASVGLATDGDADRIGIVDENGVFLNQLQVFALLALYVLEVRRDRGPIVKTVTSSAMLNKLGELYGVKVFETPVGFKYVAPVMLREGASIGGEESGGYGFHRHVPERDSFVAGLYFLDFMVKTGKTPSQLLQWLYSMVGPHYYEREDFPLSWEDRRLFITCMEKSCPGEIAGRPVARLDTSDGYRFILDDGSWLLLRFSGTEPLIRVYAEANSPDRVKSYLAAGRELLGIGKKPLADGLRRE